MVTIEIAPPFFHAEVPQLAQDVVDPLARKVADDEIALGCHPGASLQRERHGTDISAKSLDDGIGEIRRADHPHLQHGPEA